MFGRTNRCIEVSPQHTIAFSKEQFEKIEEFAKVMGGPDIVVKNLLRNASIGVQEDLIKTIFSNDSWFDIIVMKVIENSRLSEKIKRVLIKK